jgi:hypothetical protein
VLVYIFCKGYNFFDAPIQRCWVHYLCDLNLLVEVSPDNENFCKWVESIKDIYKAAKKIARQGFIEAIRVEFRRKLEMKLLAIAQPYLNDKSAPQRI